MKKALLLMCLVFGFTSQAQLVITNNQTPTELVQDVLLGAGVTVSNVTFNGSVGNANLIRDQAARFSGGATTNLGLDAGVILATGKASIAPGPNNSTSTTAATDNPVQGDADLGMLIPNPSSIRNVAILEFDFIPTGQDLSFNFVFASEEYPEYANTSFNDAFGFFLSGPGITGTFSNQAVNIALIPNTTSYVTINTVNHINNNAFYIANTQNGVQYDGFTVVIPAMSTVTCGETYHIKLAIGNVSDNSLDSAVFLQANSFSTTPIDLGGDLTVDAGTALCNGAEYEICTGLDATIPHQWYFNGVPITGATDPCITVSEGGQYCVDAYPYGPGCPVNACVTIEIQPAILPITNTPPDLAECGNIFDLTQVEDDVFAGENPSNFDVYYFNSQFNADNGIADIPNTTAYEGEDGEVIFIKIESLITSGCYQVMPFTLHILGNAIVDNPADVETCTPYTLPALTNGNYFTATQGGGEPLSAGDVISSTTTLFVFSGGPIACSAEESFTITIVDALTIVDPTPYQICDNDYDGFAIFNLPTKNNEITASAPLTVQYFAAGSTTAILNVTNYQNTTPNTQTLTVHIFDPASPECYSATTLQLVVNPIPTVVAIADYPLCESSTPADGIEDFDLSTKTVEIIDGQEDIEVTYYTSQTAAQEGIAGTEINTAALYPSATAVVWVRLENSVTGCFAINSFNVVVNPRPATLEPAPMFECSNGVTETASFDLVSNNAQITGTVGPEVTVTYHLTLANAETGDNPLASPYETETTIVFIRVYNATTTCFNTTTIALNVTEAPTIVDPTPLEVCDDNYDGLASFNLTLKNDEIAGVGTGLTVEYFETSTSLTPIPTPTNYQIINPNTYTLTVRVFDPLAPECVSVTTLVLIVNTKPEIVPIAAYQLCETSIPADGMESFDLSTMTAAIINGQANIGVTYYTTQALAQGGVAGTEIDTAVPYDSPSALIWVRLENTETECFAVTSFNLVVNPRPDAFEPAVMNGCSNGVENIASFNLTLNNPQVTGGAGGVVVTYHLTIEDAEDAINPLPNPYVSGPATIYIRVENTTTGCYNTTQVELNVTQGPTANTPTPLEVCDPNSDGFSTFNLTDANEQISGGPVPAGVTITYHETDTDALYGENALSPIYDNNVPYLQTIWVNVSYTLTGCSNIVELVLIVNNTPVATEIPALEVCDDNSDGFAAFDLTTAIDGILNTLDPTTHTVTFYTTQANAQAATNVITSTTSFTNMVANTQTIWVRVENNDTGCFDVISLDLIVNALPLVAAPIPAYTLCDVNNPGDQKEEFDLQSTIPMILNGQDGMEVSFYFDQANALAQTNALPYLYTNVSNAQTIWVRVENLATGCYVLSRMDLRVEPLPVLYPPTDAVSECDQDGNGFATFDLDALVADLLQGEPNTTVTFHLTEQDALTSSNGLSSPYDNTTAFIDFIWVRAENNITGCFSVLMIELNVTAAPKVPALDPIVQCDQDSNPQDGYTTFDLTVQNQIILDAQTGAGPYIVTYYTSEDNANAGLAPIIQDTFYTNTSNPQTIWVRVDDDNSDCFAVKSFEISVNLPIVLTRPTPLSLCDDGPTTTLPQTVFDLTVKNEEIVGTATEYSIVYFPSYADALAGTNVITDPTEYTNIANAQTLGVMVTSADGCISYTTMDIRVLPLPTPLTDLSGLDIEGCEDTLGSGEGIFDLTQNEEYIADEDPNLVFEYYLSEQDAIDGVNAIADPTNYTGAAGTIWIKIMNASLNYLGDACYVIIQQNILVNGLPILNDPTEYKFCDIGATGTAEFTLDTHNDEVLEEGQDIADFAFAYYLNQADAEADINQLDNLYTNITNPQDIVVAVTHGDTECKSFAVVTLVVAEGAVATTPTAYVACDTDVDGILIIDLETLFDTEILGAQAAPEFTVSYYPTLEDAQGGTNAIDPATAYPASTSIVFAAVNNTTTGCRSIPVEVDITIEALPNPVITTDADALCVDFVTGLLNSGLVLDSNLDPALYTFEWSLAGDVIPGAVGATYSIDTIAPGVYSVVATSVSALGCPSAAGTFTVIKSGPAVPVGAGFTVTNAFSDNQTLTVTVEGFGDYVYSLDGGSFLDNDGIFPNITPGAHTVEVHDQNSCEDDLVLEVFAINYPHFFTPNGDGINDTWNITTLASDLSAKIYIFDRYGKLIKQISPSGEGWNGTFNGKLLPSSDYWFTVFYLENGTNKEFKAHFSLKR